MADDAASASEGVPRIAEGDRVSALTSRDYARIARHFLDARRARLDIMPRELFGEPAWDMLLDLFIAHHEGKRISVSSACIASGGSATTALRWLSRLEALGLIVRVGDSADRRRIFIELTQETRARLEHWAGSYL